MTQKARTDLTTGKGVTNLFGPLSLRQVRDLVQRTRDWPEESTVDLNNADGGSTLLVCHPESSSGTQGLETGTVDPATEPAGGSAGQQDSTAPPEGRPAGWYRSMEHPWAARHYGFPADPDEGAQWNAEDGSGWTFDLTGSGWWEISRYANDARVAELEAEADRLRERRRTWLLRYRTARDRIAELEAASQTSREMYTSARERGKPERLDAAVKLLEYAMQLRMYGERAPGGDETWREWDARAERFLRGLTDITEEHE